MATQAEILSNQAFIRRIDNFGVSTAPGSDLGAQVGIVRGGGPAPTKADYARRDALIRSDPFHYTSAKKNRFSRFLSHSSQYATEAIVIAGIAYGGYAAAAQASAAPAAASAPASAPAAAGAPSAGLTAEAALPAYSSQLAAAQSTATASGLSASGTGAGIVGTAKTAVLGAKAIGSVVSVYSGLKSAFGKDDISDAKFSPSNDGNYAQPDFGNDAGSPIETNVAGPADTMGTGMYLALAALAAIVLIKG